MHITITDASFNKLLLLQPEARVIATENRHCSRCRIEPVKIVIDHFGRLAKAVGPGMCLCPDLNDDGTQCLQCGLFDILIQIKLEGQGHR